jgi:uncharacterized protein YigE (DUF2233 family)
MQPHSSANFNWVALLGLLLALSTTSAPAATLASYGQDDQMIDACLLNLSQDTVRMFWRAADGSVLGGFGRLGASLSAHNEKLICATNAGIYGTDLRPIGLYVEAGKVLRKLNKRKDAYGNFYLQPNGVLLLADDEAVILTTDEIDSQWETRLPFIRYATQSGPILLRNGQINPLFPEGSDNRVVRNAACTFAAGNFALVKSRFRINFHDFARQLRDKLSCRDALYLDGSISQLYPFDHGGLGPNFAVIIGATMLATSAGQ